MVRPREEDLVGLALIPTRCVVYSSEEGALVVGWF